MMAITAAGAAPLTDAELDHLDALHRARTPGPLAIARDRHGQANIFGGPDGEEWIALLPHQCIASLETPRESDARAIVAALNALPALLAEVRRWRGRERARNAWAEPDGDDGADVASDDGPRLHIPRDLLAGSGG